jgi:hypothetical protein
MYANALKTETSASRFARALGLLMLAAVVAACGGGGGTRGAALCQPGVSTMAFPNGCPGDNLGGGGGAVGATTLTLALVDAGGAVVNQVTPAQKGSLRATIKNSAGAALPNVAVSFITSDTTGGFVPTSGTALTDAAGIASVGLPAGRQSGAFTATASATVAGAATSGLIDYAVAFPPLTLGPVTINPSTLSAGGNAAVSVGVLSGGTPYTAPLAVSFSSPCIITGKATMGPPVLTQNGIAATSYTDKGCGVVDVITASVTLGDATATQTGRITVLPATAGSIKFITADTTNIALAGTGGFGRQEFSTLKFEVSDRTGSKIPGTLVDFVFADTGTATTVGGLTLNPSFATSAADGTVTTLVTSGTIPTSVRVIATLRDSAPRISTLSDTLVVSSGVPDQKHFSLATSIGNCEGRDIDQACSTVTVTMGDHFGNPVPDGTAVNFSAEGGVIDASCVTGSLPPPGATPAGQTTNSKVGPGSGSCSVLLRSSNPRSADGRITVLAYALGEEDFTDSNGNNVYDAGEPYTDKSPDIHRDDNESLGWTAGEPCVGPNGNGSCTTAGNGTYNGVLRFPRVPSAQNLYVSGQLVQIFSGSDAFITITPSQLVCPAGRTADVSVRVVDINQNIMPAGTLIEFSTINAGIIPFPVNPSSSEVNNVVLAVGELPLPMLVRSQPATVGCLGGESGRFIVNVTTPSGKLSTASIPIN